MPGEIKVSDENWKKILNSKEREEIRADAKKGVTTYVNVSEGKNVAKFAKPKGPSKSREASPKDMRL